MRQEMTGGVTGGCVVEMLETRRLSSVTVPDVTGDFAGGAVYENSGVNEFLEFQITDQRNSKFYGTFLQGDGSAGILVGTVNKRGVTTITYQSTNLYSNYKGKAKGFLSGDGSLLAGGFQSKLGRQHMAGTFSVNRIGPDLGKKSG